MRESTPDPTFAILTLLRHTTGKLCRLGAFVLMFLAELLQRNAVR